MTLHGSTSKYNLLKNNSFLIIYMQFKINVGDPDL